MRYALLVCVEEGGELNEADAGRQYGEFMAFQDEMEGARRLGRPRATAADGAGDDGPGP